MQASLTLVRHTHLASYLNDWLEEEGWRGEPSIIIQSVYFSSTVVGLSKVSTFGTLIMYALPTVLKLLIKHLLSAYFNCHES